MSLTSIISSDALVERWVAAKSVEAREGWLSLIQSFPGKALREKLPERYQAAGALDLSSNRAAQSVLLLVRYGSRWDAEVVFRTALEGTLKFCWLLSDEVGFDSRYRELAEILPDAHLLKMSRKVSRALGVLPDAADQKFQGMRDMVLTDEQMAELETRHSKDVRRAAEARWGFTTLVELISKSELPFANSVGALLHSYSISSLITHCESRFNETIYSIDKRAPDRRRSYEMAHTSRILSDVLTTTGMRLLIAHKFCGTDKTPSANAYAATQKLRDEFDEAQDLWNSIEYAK